MRRLILTFVLCLLACPVLADDPQEPIPNFRILGEMLESPPTWGVLHSDLTILKKNGSKPKIGKDFWALVVISKGLKIWDIELTQRRKQRDPTWHEFNPLLPRRPGRTRMHVQFMGVDLGADYFSYRLRRAGHPGWARVIQVGSIALSAWGIQQNARYGLGR